jgi:hypothetical protein
MRVRLPSGQHFTLEPQPFADLDDSLKRERDGAGQVMDPHTNLLERETGHSE